MTDRAFALPTRPVLAAASLAALLAATAMPVQAQESPWQLRVRAVKIDPADKDRTGLGLSLSQKTIPEVDISYFLTRNIAAELVLTVPQRHTLYSEGTRIGSVKQLPPTLPDDRFESFQFSIGATF